mmetsp:Transcript_12313/g.41044  ORF Transcript_12313/g.41044 Transcript_12313/m.41044 type:complete len:229 (-) Transcript_12313:696-1382(-)
MPSSAAVKSARWSPCVATMRSRSGSAARPAATKAQATVATSCEFNSSKRRLASAPSASSNSGASTRACAKAQATSANARGLRSASLEIAFVATISYNLCGTSAPDFENAQAKVPSCCESHFASSPGVTRADTAAKSAWSRRSEPSLGGGTRAVSPSSSAAAPTSVRRPSSSNVIGLPPSFAEWRACGCAKAQANCEASLGVGSAERSFSIAISAMAKRSVPSSLLALA